MHKARQCPVLGAGTEEVRKSLHCSAWSVCEVAVKARMPFIADPRAFGSTGSRRTTLPGSRRNGASRCPDPHDKPCGKSAVGLVGLLSGYSTCLMARLTATEPRAQALLSTHTRTLSVPEPGCAACCTDLALAVTSRFQFWPSTCHKQVSLCTYHLTHALLMIRAGQQLPLSHIRGSCVLLRPHHQPPQGISPHREGPTTRLRPCTA